MNTQDSRMTPDEYVDFHIRIEEEIRRESTPQPKGGAPGQDGDAGDSLCLQGGDGGPD